MQLPLGALLDRYGPRMIQSALLLLASAGSLVFALADGLLGLLIGRALLGLGVALALMAGFKAIVLWFPPGRIALVNGWLVMLGALGAVTATAPAEAGGASARLARPVRSAGGLVGSGGAAGPVRGARADRHPPRTEPREGRQSMGDLPRSTLLAHCTAVRSRHRHVLVTTRSVGGTLAARRQRPGSRRRRAAPRRDGDRRLPQRACCSARRQIGSAAGESRTESVLASTLVLSMAAQTALVCAWPIPAYLLWAVIAAAGAATVLSFAILSEYFPKEMSGRANAALNLLHVGGAFVLQSATGLIIELWPAANGTYPVDAHQTAMAASIVVQLAALAWFALATRSQPASAMQGLVTRAATGRRTQLSSASTRYPTSLWSEQSRTGHQATGWCFAATASAALCVALATALASTIGHANLAAHIVEVDRPTVSADSSTLRDASTATTAMLAIPSGGATAGSPSPTNRAP